MKERISGSLFIHKKGWIHTIENVESIKGFGRWIYCKYCYKNVLPQISGLNQIVCSQCGSGLTPDFFSFKALEIYWKTDDFDLARDEDIKSPERISQLNIWAKESIKNRKERSHES